MTEKTLEQSCLEAELQKLERHLKEDWEYYFTLADGDPSFDAGVEALTHFGIYDDEKCAQLNDWAKRCIESGKIEQDFDDKLVEKFDITPTDYKPNDVDIEARLTILAAVSDLLRSKRFAEENNFKRSLFRFARSTYLHGRHASACIAQEREWGRAQKAAYAKLAKDPKQAAKVLVRECWDLWQLDPTRYKGPTKFANDMIEKYEELESRDVVMRWCRVWKNEATEQAES